MKFYSVKKEGFSLIEIMIIVSIVLVGMLGVISLLLQNLKAQTINKNRLIAYQLAQEAIEIVRATRDNYSINNDTNFLTNFPYKEYSCSYNRGIKELLGSQNETAVCLDGSGFYGSFEDCPDISKPNTIFRRTVELSPGNDGTNNFLQVQSVINWTERNKNYSYQLETQLYDWY